MTEQYTDFNSLVEHRKLWIRQGHKNVPDPECSCGFLGHSRPEFCKVLPHKMVDITNQILKNDEFGGNNPNQNFCPNDKEMKSSTFLANRFKESWDRSYWNVGSSAWKHYFKEVKYNNGDVVWVSKLTGVGYAGRTHDGLFWNSYNSIPKKINK